MAKKKKIIYLTENHSMKAIIPRLHNRRKNNLLNKRIKKCKVVMNKFGKKCSRTYKEIYMLKEVNT